MNRLPAANNPSALPPPFDVLYPMVVRAAALVALAAAVALVVNTFHPMGLPILPGEVPHPGIPVWVWHTVHIAKPAEAHDLWRRHAAIFVDVRDEKDFAIGHIPDSSPTSRTLSLPYHSFTATFPKVAARLPKHAPILVYCYGSECGLSMRVVKRLLALGYDHLSSLEGGIAGWGSAGYPLTGPLAHRGVIEGAPTLPEGGAKP